MSNLKYKVGDTVYAKDRYDGVVKRTIKSIVSEEFKTYELDSYVQVTKQQYIGTTKKENWVGMFDEESVAFPAPEEYLFQIGEPVFDGMFGVHEDTILTKSMINNEDE